MLSPDISDDEAISLAKRRDMEIERGDVMPPIPLLHYGMVFPCFTLLDNICENA